MAIQKQEKKSKTLSKFEYLTYKYNKSQFLNKDKYIVSKVHALRLNFWTVFSSRPTNSSMPSILCSVMSKSFSLQSRDDFEEFW